MPKISPNSVAGKRVLRRPRPLKTKVTLSAEAITITSPPMKASNMPKRGLEVFDVFFHSPYPFFLT
jgi:hypothetical protein